MIAYSISNEAWLALKKMYTSQSQVWILQVCTQLATLGKASSTVFEYFHCVKSLSNTLAFARHPHSEDEFIAFLLARLRSNYDLFVTYVAT